MPVAYVTVSSAHTSLGTRASGRIHALLLPTVGHAWPELKVMPSLYGGNGLFPATHSL